MKSSPSPNSRGCLIGAGKSRLPGCAPSGGKTLRRPSQPAPTAVSRRATKFFLNSYHPLCETQEGRDIATRHGIPPFVDFSIRREPDFQNPFPSVTGLCRCNKLVGPAESGDFIAYITVKSAGPRRLVALLQVLHKFPHHAAAAEWYRSKGLDLPSNCIVPRNEALPLELAARPGNFTTYEEWVSAYRWRARMYPSFLICRAVGGPELSDPPLITDNFFGRAFPNKRSPRALTETEFNKLRRLLQ